MTHKDHDITSTTMAKDIKLLYANIQELAAYLTGVFKDSEGDIDAKDVKTYLDTLKTALATAHDLLITNSDVFTKATEGQVRELGAIVEKLVFDTAKEVLEPETCEKFIDTFMEKFDALC